MELETFPNIIWRIKKFSSVKNLSRNISYMGMIFKLELQQLFYRSSLRVILTLENVSSRSIKGLCQGPFKVQTYLLTSSRRFTAKRTWALKRQRKLSIWSQSSKKIKGRNVTFMILIVPDVTARKIPIPKNSVNKNRDGDNETCIKSLMKDIDKLYNCGMDSDVVLRCGKRNFLAHKIILSARSDVFAAMFRSNMREAQENVVVVKSIEPGILEALLRYMYTGEVNNMPPYSIRELYKAADMYAVEALKVKCSSLFIDKVVMDSNPEDTGTMQPAIKHLKELFQSDKWKMLCLKNPDWPMKCANPFC